MRELDLVTLPLMVVDPQRRVTRFNRAAQDLTGHVEREALGRRCSDLLLASACSINCPEQALAVQSGVGCAAAVINQALGRSGGDCCSIDETSCCG